MKEAGRAYILVVDNILFVKDTAATVASGPEIIHDRCFLDVLLEELSCETRSSTAVGLGRSSSISISSWSRFNTELRSLF